MFQLIYNQSLSTSYNLKSKNLCYELFFKNQKSIYNITNGTMEFNNVSKK